MTEYYDYSLQELKEMYTQRSKIANVYKTCTDGSYEMAIDTLEMKELKQEIEKREKESQEYL
jgi:hypothetical protein